ncbi:MAG: formylglycine-generating enzyme family protein [Acidobacteriota bacterium]
MAKLLKFLVLWSIAWLAWNPVVTAQPEVARVETEQQPVVDPAPGDLWVDPALDMRFRYVPPGTFTMGSPLDEPGRIPWETQHEVTLTRGVWLGETEVTQAQWREVMNTNPSKFGACGDQCPVEFVNWFEAAAFANALSERAGFYRCYAVSGANGKKPGRGLTYESVERVVGCTGYRLPTEAEWERAARAGTSTALYAGDITILGAHNAPALDLIAWYGGNSGADYAQADDCSEWPAKQVADSTTCGPQPVGGKEPNAWNLVDLLGNVWEWCEDHWNGGDYAAGATDPVAREGSGRVIRGGSWYSLARNVRSAVRDGDGPAVRDSYVGFRLARDHQPAGSESIDD